MKKKIKEQWVSALRSGTYKQGYEELRSSDRGSYCCLGVLCDLYDKSHKRDYWKLDLENNMFTMLGQWKFLPVEVARWAGLSETNPTVLGNTLTSLNDNLIEFNEIAAVIERSL